MGEPVVRRKALEERDGRLEEGHGLGSKRELTSRARQRVTHVLAGLIVAEAGGLEGCVARSVLVPFMLPEFLVGFVVAQPVLCLVSALFPSTDVTTPTSCM